MNEYYDLLAQIQSFKAQHQYQKVFNLCMESLQYVSEMVRSWVSMDGHFAVASIPCIELGCRYLAVVRDKDKLQDILHLTRENVYLNPWSNTVSLAIEDVDLAEKLFAYLKEHPGFQQNVLGKALHEDGRRISNLLVYAKHLDLVRTESFGRMHKVYLTL